MELQQHVSLEFWRWLERDAPQLNCVPMVRLANKLGWPGVGLHVHLALLIGRGLELSFYSPHCCSWIVFWMEVERPVAETVAVGLKGHSLVWNLKRMHEQEKLISQRALPCFDISRFFIVKHL